MLFFYIPFFFCENISLLTAALKYIFQCTCATGMCTLHADIVTLCFFQCTMYHFMSTVDVNKMIRSGCPICVFRLPDILVNTFALHLCFLQICLYCCSILSLPPMITTLIFITCPFSNAADHEYFSIIYVLLSSIPDLLYPVPY